MVDVGPIGSRRQNVKYLCLFTVDTVRAPQCTCSARLISETNGSEVFYVYDVELRCQKCQQVLQSCWLSDCFECSYSLLFPFEPFIIRLL